MGLIRPVPLPIDLDFSRPRRAPGRGAWLFLAIAVFVGGMQFADHRRASSDMDEREAALLRMREENLRASGASSAPERPVTTEEAKGALDVAARLNADWSGVLSGIVAAQGEGVSWVSLQVEQSRAAVNIGGNARTLGDVFEFLARLGATPAVRDARLANYEWTRIGNQNAVRFTVNARWSTGR